MCLKQVGLMLHTTKEGLVFVKSSYRAAQGYLVWYTSTWGDLAALFRKCLCPTISGRLQMQSKRGNPVCPQRGVSVGVCASICDCLHVQIQHVYLLQPPLAVCMYFFFCVRLSEVPQLADAFNLEIDTQFFHFSMPHLLICSVPTKCSYKTSSRSPFLFSFSFFNFCLSLYLLRERDVCF